MSYLLTFFMDLRPSKSLLEGRMILTKDGDLVDVYIATSGAPGWQNRHNVAIKGRGAIPATWDVEIKKWEVETKAIPMPHKKGIEGNFYAIKPFTVQIDGFTRGDFGIHADANVPGSAGCIVLPPKGNGWREFQEAMKAIALEGVSRIPLQVAYC